MICDRGITLIGISLSNLDDDGSLQLELPLGRPRPGLDGAVDRVRERYGSSALTRGVLLGSDPGSHRAAAARLNASGGQPAAKPRSCNTQVLPSRSAKSAKEL